jgi:hypothetical protein
MLPFQPSGPRYPWTDTSALFKRNALQMGPLAPELEEHELGHAPAADQVDISTKATTPRDAGEAAEKAEKERTRKAYRKPVYPHPQAPAPRQSSGGWMLSRPASHEKSREMTEDDLELYSRWRRDESEGEHGQPEEQVEEAVATPEEEQCDVAELTQAGLEPETAEPLAAMLKIAAGTPGREQLARWLARFGPGILSTCRGQGISVVLCLSGQTAYREPEKRVYVAAAELAAAEEDFATLFQAFARAYDVALGEGSCASANSVAVLASLQGNDPGRFFAEAIADYMRGATGPLHGYVEYLIRQSHVSRT